MRPEPPRTALAAGDTFPDLSLPDHTGLQRTLSEIANGDPVALFFSRGWWCPKARPGESPQLSPPLPPPARRLAGG